MQSQYSVVAFLSGVVLISSIYLNRSFFNIGVTTVDNADVKIILFIGIISSPDHFRQRQSQRKTWLSVLPDSFQYRFVVGDKACKIHPLDRMSPYTCEDLNYIMPENSTENSLLFANSVNLPDSCDTNCDNNIGFSFHVHHPIVVRYIGLKKCYYEYTLTQDKVVNIVLADIQGSKHIASVTFDHNSLLKDSSERDYVFKRLLTPVILPKGFEGVIKVEGLEESIQGVTNMDSADWTHGNFFSTLNIISRNMIHTSSNYCGLSTFSFTIKDFRKLETFVKEKQNRGLEWLQHYEETRAQLQIENERYKDIIFLDIVDTYRNLPKKVLSLYKWVFTNITAKYLLKTDDDTFVDIKRVEIELNNTSDWDWWSCFRVGWPVQRYGKWREVVYQHKVYPPFPCGAGYILSGNVLTWINERMENLTTSYQGEDVALGIWLEGMNASAHIGLECYWACNQQCHSRSCNMMELSINDVYKVWEDYQMCGNRMCHCPDPI